MRWVGVLVSVMLAISFALVAHRTLRGPTQIDRILGVDMLGYVAVGGVGDQPGR